MHADTISLGKSLCLQRGENEFSIRIEKLHLNPGLYTIGFKMANPPHFFDQIEQGGTMEVVGRKTQGFGHRAAYDGTVTCSFSVTEAAGRTQDSYPAVSDEESSPAWVLPPK